MPIKQPIFKPQEIQWLKDYRRKGKPFLAGQEKKLSAEQFERLKDMAREIDNFKVREYFGERFVRDWFHGRHEKNGLGMRPEDDFLEYNPRLMERLRVGQALFLKHQIISFQDAYHKMDEFARKPKSRLVKAIFNELRRTTPWHELGHLVRMARSIKAAEKTRKPKYEKELLHVVRQIIEDRMAFVFMEREQAQQPRPTFLFGYDLMEACQILDQT